MTSLTHHHLQKRTTMRTLTTTGLAASAALLLALTGCSAASQDTAEADTSTEAASL